MIRQQKQDSIFLLPCSNWNHDIRQSDNWTNVREQKSPSARKNSVSYGNVFTLTTNIYASVTKDSIRIKFQCEFQIQITETRLLDQTIFMWYVQRIGQNYECPRLTISPSSFTKNGVPVDRKCERTLNSSCRFLVHFTGQKFGYILIYYQTWRFSFY